jgi:hypothetical protein
MSAAPHTAAPEDRLAALAARVRRLWVVRGACGLAVAVLGSVAALLVLDAAAPLSVGARCVLQVAWLGLVVFLAWRLVASRWQGDVPLEEIEREVERQFPGLGERVRIALTAGEADLPPVVAALNHDTQRRTRDLDVSLVAPLWSAAPYTLATAAVALVACGAAMLPGAGDHLRRVMMPWSRSAGVPFEIVVTSGDAVVRRGEPVTLAAYLRPTEPNALFPEGASIAFRDWPGAAERREPMTADAGGVFHATTPAAADDFEYRVEVGSAVSPWHTVLVTDPVELADPSAAEVVPPAYATSIPTRFLPGFANLDGLQFSTVAFRLRFTRPAESVALEWRPDSRPGTDPPDLVPIELAGDRTGGTASIQLRVSGTLRLLLVNEPGPRKLRTELTAAVRVAVDAPPRLEHLTGISTQPGTVHPGAQVPISLAAVDDVGVRTAVLEYAVGPADAKVEHLAIPLTGAGTPRAEGRLLFDLAGKGREGDTIRYRLRVTDTRSIDEVKLGPQEVVYPPSGWAELRLSATAPPLDQQEVFGQRDAVRANLTAIFKEVADTRTAVEALRADTAGHSPLPVDHAVRLGQLRERTQKTAALLYDCSRDAALTPDLRPLAGAVDAVVDGPVRAAGDALRTAATDSPADRQAALAAARDRLAEAAGQVEGLLKQNDRLARERLDRRRLAALAADQARLADRVKAGKPDDLFAAQRDLLGRLNHLIADSDALKQSVDAVAGREAARFAAELKALAAALRGLNAATDQHAADVRRWLLDDLARQHAGLAKQAEGVLPTMATAARLAGATLSKPAEFRRAADLIANDQIVDALVELEKLALALDRTAAEFDLRAAERKDPKAATRQLARWQDDLREQFAAATRETPFDKLPDPAKATFRMEQTALAKAVEQLKLPADPSTTALRDAALVHLGFAVKRLDAEGAEAEVAMRLAADALDRLAEKTPTAAERLARTRPELEKLRLEQDAIVTAAEQVVRQHEKYSPTGPVIKTLAQKFAPVQARQQKLADRLAELDLPSLEPRRARALLALKAAAADLKAGLPFDAVASLAWAKREIDRLRTAADGQVPPDDAADDLAGKQAAVADMVRALGHHPTAKQLEPAVAAQLDVLRLFVPVAAAPEAPVLMHDATEALKQAKAAAEACQRDAAKHPEFWHRAAVAAVALARLADRLNGREPDRDRVRRLAGLRRAAEAEAKKLAGKSFNADVSGEAKRQLAREAEELAVTRVGAAGQVGKKLALDLYALLQLKSEPDHLAGNQKRLADALDELAGAMANVPELTAKPAALVPAHPDPADRVLPSKPLADALRETARRLRATREQANRLTADVAARLGPVDEAALAGAAGGPAVAATPQARYAALAKRAGDLSQAFEMAAENVPPDHPTGKALESAAGLVRSAEQVLDEAAEKAAGGMPREARDLRAAAERHLQQAVDQLDKVSGGAEAMPTEQDQVGEAVRDAERAMRRAVGLLGRKGDALAAEPAMRAAVEALRRAVR